MRTAGEFLNSAFCVLRSAFAFSIRNSEFRTRNEEIEGRTQNAEFRMKKAAIAVTAVVVGLLPTVASACPVCFGDPSSDLNKGAANGILFMLAIIGLVQIGFIALFWTFWRRAKALRARREQFQLIDGGLQ
jgi:hypothetical protein